MTIQQVTKTDLSVDASLPAVVDPNNSSVVPLAGDAVFTGTPTEVLLYTAVTVVIFSDEDGAPDGLSVEFSQDGTNWDIAYAVTYITNGVEAEHSTLVFPRLARYFRLIYTNGSTPQTVFRLQALLDPIASGPAIHRLDSDEPGDRLSSLSKAALIAQRSGGSTDFIPVEATASGSIHVSIEEPNPLQTEQGKIGSVVDPNNSTNTPLAGGAVFTGTRVDLLGYTTVVLTLHSSHDSAAGGMEFQFSTDNVNWDDIYTFTMDVSSSDTRRFQFPVTARYFRLVYTNGGTLQTSFRVQTILHTMSTLMSVHRLDDDTSPDRSAAVVKAAIIAKGPGGSPDFIPIEATNGGNLKVAVEESVPIDVASVAIPSTVIHGQKTITTPGTEEALGATTTLISGVTVKALASNTGIVYVGANPVTSSTGFELAAGEQIFIEVDDLDVVYLDVSVGGEGVSYIGS